MPSLTKINVLSLSASRSNKQVHLFYVDVCKVSELKLAQIQDLDKFRVAKYGYVSIKERELCREICVRTASQNQSSKKALLQEA
jgi:hypothetical protein